MSWENRGSKRSWESRDGGGDKEMCGDFKRGDCSRGDRCRFSHGDGKSGGGGGGSRLDDRGKYGNSDWGRDKGQEMCGDFKRGDCTRGDRCRFSHGEDGGGGGGKSGGGKGKRGKKEHVSAKSLDDDLDKYFGKEPKKTTDSDKLDDKLDAYFGKDKKEEPAKATVKCGHADCNLAVHSDKTVSETFCCKLCEEASKKEPRESPAHGKRCEKREHKEEEEKKDAEEKKEEPEDKKAEDKKADESE